MKRMDEGPDPDDRASTTGSRLRSGSPEPSLWGSDDDENLPPRGNIASNPAAARPSTAPSRRPSAAPGPAPAKPEAASRATPKPSAANLAAPKPGGASAPARVVARIIDPSVRDDGRGDPQFTLEPRRERVADTPRLAGSPHPVRERLLAKARAALDAVPEPTPKPSPPAPVADEAWFAGDAASHRSETGQVGVESPPDVADDLDLIGAPERPRPERTPHMAPALPTLTALLLGSGAGLAAIALLFAALIQLDPHDALHRPGPPVVEAPEPPPGEPPPAPVPQVKRPPRRRVPGPWRIADAAPDARLRRIQGSMGKKTFLAATQAAGLNLKEAYRVITAFEGIKNLDRCRSKDTFDALVDAQSGRLSAFEYVVREEDVYQARENADGRLVAKKLDLMVERQRAQGVVVVESSFEDAAQRAGFEPGLDTFVNKALSGYTTTADLKPGDVLGLVVQEVTVLGAFARYAGVEALEYRPAGGEPLRVYYQELDKSRGYVDAKGRVFGKSRWTRPVPGARVTSRYNPKRMHPILKRIKPHNGTDFGAPIGTPVVAAAAGKVSFVGRAGPNGNMITIAHDGGFQTGYSHLSRFVKGLKVGARVARKQAIGYVGTTGRSTGPHLHFSVKKRGRFVDPESLNLDGLLRLTVDQRLSSDLRRRYDRMLDALDLPALKPPVPPSPELPPDPNARALEVEIAAARAAPAATPAASPTPAASTLRPGQRTSRE